jgi:immune inhibitor A
MNFSSKQVTRVFTSPHSQNAWGHLQDIGWRKVEKKSDDGVTNMFLILTAAKANNRTVSGTINDDKLITLLYLN